MDRTNENRYRKLAGILERLQQEHRGLYLHDEMVDEENATDAEPETPRWWALKLASAEEAAYFRAEDQGFTPELDAAIRDAGNF